MITSNFESLEDVILDEHFPQVDHALRRGKHIGREDGAVYDYLVDAMVHFETFYQRLGYDFVHRSDGYFYLLPMGDQIGRRHLTAAEMLVGQMLALMYLDPATLQSGGVVMRETILQRLEGLVGKETLVRTFNPRRRKFNKFNERTAAENVRTKVAEAIRRLDELGFIDLAGESTLRLRPALMRFADPVRALGDQKEAMERLIKSGEITMVEDDEPDNQEDNGMKIDEEKNL